MIAEYPEPFLEQTVSIYGLVNGVYSDAVVSGWGCDRISNIPKIKIGGGGNFDGAVAE